jgi:SPRY domain
MSAAADRALATVYCVLMVCCVLLYCAVQIRSYGELFREGDTIGVHVDMDVGVLSFTRNGRDLGIAVQVNPLLLLLL